MIRISQRSEVCDKVAFLGREQESVQENHVGNMLVDNGECSVGRVNDDNLCFHALTERVLKVTSLR